MKIYTKSIHIEASHLDERKHVNNTVYLKWVQDISKDHWDKESSKEINQNFYWVVRNHFIEYKREVFEGDILLVKTFVKGYKGPFSERHVEFYCQEKLVAASKSNWCLISIQTKKPEKVPIEIQKLFQNSPI